MNKRFFTIGMAGHIDHGKTTLTKALTNVDTDRLKEEKERQISIELGFAPLYEDADMQISVVDVPGHERFIRQMIAGVAGIDLVVLVVAADEGVMPQTREHLNILGFLGIKQGIVAITKIDRVDEELLELVKDDILEALQGTVFAQAPFVLTDSLSSKGIAELKSLIIDTLKAQETRDAKGAFRLPVDQVFTVKGQGTVVRGTVYEGLVEEGQALTIMPKGLEVRARQLQVHHRPAVKAFAGQRTAINLSGVSKADIKRGDVLVSSEHFTITSTIDVALRTVGDLEYMVKQRMPIKCHIGTAEVMGRIVFFDRNELKEETGEILCQLRLAEAIVVKRGDRFIIRRPSPAETIGGGWVIDPSGDKYRYGMQTVAELEKKKEGTPKDRIIAALAAEKVLPLAQLCMKTSLDEGTLLNELQADEFLQLTDKEYTHHALKVSIEDELCGRLAAFHEENPMKLGINKAELLQQMQMFYPKRLLEFVLENGVANSLFSKNDNYIRHADFSPHVPENWQKRTDNMLYELRKDEPQVKYLQDYFTSAGIPGHLSYDLQRLLTDIGEIAPLDEQFFWSGKFFQDAVAKLQASTDTAFEVADAKKILGLSRKYVIPFLERLDALELTARYENKRRWLKK